MTSIRLSASLDLLAAKPLRDELLAQRGRPVSLDASMVTRLGGQCLQVLLAAQRTWREDDVPLEVSAPSGAFVEHARLLGAAATLGLECDGATQ